jgi:hypothetical protein
MFANTIDISILGATVTLQRVNQDNFGSTYKAIGSDYRAQMQIRHSVDPAKGSTGPLDRHNVFLEVWHTPTTDNPTGATKYSSSTVTIRADQRQSVSNNTSVASALNAFVASGTILADLMVGVN